MYNFFNPTRVLFGAGQLGHLHEQTMPGKKAMVVISNGKSTRENGTLDRTMNELHQAGATGKMQPLVNPTLPIIAITTTAGTGSEVDQWGVVTNPETNEKIGCGGMDSLFPVITVVDPELMATVPPQYTAYQGFDALFHSTEGYMSGVTSLMGDMVQLAAIENIGKYLARAVKDGSDMEAREHVAFANTMSGYSMVVGACTSEHAMEHAMSAYHQDLPHGAGAGQD